MEDNKKMQQTPITFLHGEETDVVIARTKEQMEQSLLNEQYKQALSVINDIIVGSAYELEKGTPVSNVVAFCGDRGEGKTSALLTIHNILKGEDSFANAEDAELFPKNKKISKDSFKVLRLVEPAFFDENHHLIELLIGQMYADILRADKSVYIDENRCEASFNENIARRNHLMQHFQEVRSSLRIINTPSNQSPYDNLEEIDQLAAGIELKEKINDLMHCYAKYFGKERVLISIDDLDLNITEGYTMAEEIRKYLSSPRVCVVMMAIKIDQLVEVVQSYLRKQLHPIVPNETITEMALRYVTKLLPLSNRIMMPTGDSIVEKQLVIRNGENIDQFESVKESVVQLIYRKTRYIFVNGRNLSPIVPTNLRSVRHLIGLLCNMPNVTDTNGEEITRNKADFKHYFYHTWVRNLNAKDAAFVEELVKTDDLVAINKSVIIHLRSVLASNLSEKSIDNKLNEQLATLLNPLNTMQNVSLGDVFCVLNYIDDTIKSVHDNNLVFFLRAYYSIKLYDLYNIISESENNLFLEEVDKKPTIYKHDVELRHLNVLQRLVNGSYFTYAPGSILPVELQKAPRDKRSINGRMLIERFRAIRNSTKPEERLRALRTCEFFALTTIHPAYSGSGVDYDRTMTSRSYYANFSTSNNYIVFDVLSIFYNMVNVKFTYQRWNDIYGQDFYKEAFNTKGSLLNEILKTCFDEHPTTKSALANNLHCMISDAVIRFSEVQLSILDCLVNRRNVQRKGGNATNIRQVYSDIQQIGITLYPIKEDEGRFEMKFHFLTPLIKWLDDSRNTSDFNKIFDISQVNYSNDDINRELDEMFRNIFANNVFKYPKRGKQIREKLRDTNKSFYSAATWKAWDTIFGVDNEYNSWEELRSELRKKIEALRAIKIKEQENLRKK